MDDKIAAPFHAGELRAQELAGGGPAGTGIRSWMPDQHRLFFAQLPFVCIGINDSDGWPVASVLHGVPGFVAAPTANRLDIAALPAPEDPAHAALHAGKPIGLLGIELPTRRRNRANGSIARLDSAGFAVDVVESFGNCPKYITPRTPVATRRVQDGVVAAFERLPPRAVDIIRSSDTLFVATSGARHGGNDVSHRGGAVTVQDNVLEIPDLPGNRYFNTLGNLLLEPRCGLLFIDFASGDVVQLQGRAEVLWKQERSWRFHIVRGWLRPGAFPLGA